MLRTIEITMGSGVKYFLISTEEKKYSRQEMDYILNGMAETSVEVNAENDITSAKVYINPNRIESFKIIV